MTHTTAIQRAEQRRKEGACGEAAKVAIALLNELERALTDINVIEYQYMGCDDPHELLVLIRNLRKETDNRRTPS